MVEPDEELLYNVRVDYWRNRSAGRCLDPYRTVPRDLVIFADALLETFSNVQSLGRKTLAFALVTEVRRNENEDDGTSVCFKVRVSKETTEGDGKNKWAFTFFLINIMTSERIWNALHMSGNLNIIKEVLFTDSMVKESCELCTESSSGVYTEIFGTILSSKMNKSQIGGVLASLHKIQCNHKSSVELICGPHVKHSSKSLVDSLTLMDIRSECLHILKNLRNSLDELQFPKNIRKDLSVDSYFQTASSIFSTASDSHKLQLVNMKQRNILVIDEAAQLKEPESTIPLQLLGIKLAILIGDEFQLPSTVKSNTCDKAGFG